MASPEGICIPWEDKPCPWCQLDELTDPGLIAECYNVDDAGKELWAVRCEYCGCIGPEATSCAEAWEKWNTRPLPWPVD